MGKQTGKEEKFYPCTRGKSLALLTSLLLPLLLLLHYGPTGGGSCVQMDHQPLRLLA